MKIGFYGNANNYPFMLARAVKRLGHEVLFLVSSTERLNRPEHLFQEIPFPYPRWIIDVSHRFRWHCLVPGLGRKCVLDNLNSCDVVILNEEGPALSAHLRVPHGVLLTGSDIEVFANPALAASLKPHVFERTRWASQFVRHILPTSFILQRLVKPQRTGIKSARFVAFLPYGLAPNADRVLEDIGVDSLQRVQLQFIDCERTPYTPPPSNSMIRLFSATRLTWLDRPVAGLTPLDLKGSDIMIRGIAQYCRETGSRFDIHLVRKGLNVDETLQLATSLGIQDQITWHEEMAQHEVLAQFRKADIILEQFGNSAVGMAGFDAMALGRPLIANGRPEIFAPLIGEPSPICQARTPEEVCAQLIRLVPSPEERLRVGLASRVYVEKHFSSDSAAARLMGAFFTGLDPL